MCTNAKSNNYVFIFLHVEKCGGTSLLYSSRRRNGLKHCDIISSRRLGNVASVSDFQRSLLLYENCDFITGHCLYPEYIEQYKDVVRSKGKEPVVITSIRNPVERLLSDYAHARRLGEKMVLSQFINIPFKKNYICNFWGSGVYSTALERINSIDYVVNIDSFEDFVCFVNTKYRLKLCRASHRNSSKAEDLPKDLLLSDGISVGKYTIDQDVYNKIISYNDNDIRLLKNIEYWTQGESDLGSAPLGIDVSMTKQLWAWIYRNLFYKLKMQRRFGLIYEKRNSVPHCNDEDINYMWEE